jgi:hypothetical protein
MKEDRLAAHFGESPGEEPDFNGQAPRLPANLDHLIASRQQDDVSLVDEQAVLDDAGHVAECPRQCCRIGDLPEVAIEDGVPLHRSCRSYRP